MAATTIAIGQITEISNAKTSGTSPAKRAKKSFGGSRVYQAIEPHPIAAQAISANRSLRPKVIPPSYPIRVAKRQATSLWRGTALESPARAGCNRVLLCFFFHRELLDIFKNRLAVSTMLAGEESPPAIIAMYAGDDPAMLDAVTNSCGAGSGVTFVRLTFPLKLEPVAVRES